MGRFFAAAIFIACIFFAGMFFGATMTEKQGTDEIESISSSYADWKKAQHAKESAQEAMEKNDHDNFFSNVAKSVSDKLKTLARTVVFHVISILEKAFGF